MQVDPYSDEFQQSPFAAYAELRATAPVYQVPDHGFYLITTHALVRGAKHLVCVRILALGHFAFGQIWTQAVYYSAA